MAPITLAVLADIHAGGDSNGPRRSEIAPILLLRAVQRINRFIRPDLTVILGDLLDQGDAPDAPARREEIKQILDRLDAPWLALPGNHDGAIDDFYQTFPRPPPAFDCNGVRFLVFHDPEEPGWNARRTPADIERLRAERRAFDGPIVCLQHVPVFPPGAAACPYNLVNAEAVIEAMRGPGLTLALAGHEHRGVPLIRRPGLAFAAAPALCEAPFRFWIIRLEKDRQTWNLREETLQLPPELELADRHIHTPFAYCNENMDIAQTPNLAREFGLAGIAFTEHSAHLYWTRRACAQGLYAVPGQAVPEGENLRADAYFEALRPVVADTVLPGLEADLTYAGELVLRDQDRRRCRLLLAAIHRLEELAKPDPDLEKAAEEFLFVTGRALEHGIDVLAHPFRVFRRARQPVPERLFAPVVRMLKESGAAAELNFHTNEPPERFVRLCLRAGVRFSLGSDSHNLYEIGEFSPHLRLLERCGVRTPDLPAVLLPWPHVPP